MPPAFSSGCGILLLVLVFGLGGCAEHAPDASTSAPYQAVLTATKQQDHALLTSVSVPLVLSQMATVRTNSRVATEDRPALPEFRAKLTTTKVPGTYQIITKVSVIEVSRTKKGKLKRSRRFEGALLPIKLDEQQSASSSSDPVQIAVKIERR